MANINKKNNKRLFYFEIVKNKGSTQNIGYLNTIMEELNTIMQELNTIMQELNTIMQELHTIIQELNTIIQELNNAAHTLISHQKTVNKATFS